MDTEKRIRRGEPEDIRLDYTSKEASGRKIARELVAMSNAKGGVIVIGVRDDDSGRPDQLENVENTDGIARSASDVLYERVAPPLEFDSEHIKIDGDTLLALSVSSADQLRSYEHESIQEPVFPIRRQTEVRYLSGNEVNKHFEKIYSKDGDRRSDDLLRLSDEKLESESEAYFIKSPDGHISEICLFSNGYYPGNPTRITVSADYIPEQKAEHIFACLDALFDVSVGDAYFTLNQENGAWIGRGYHNFVSNLRNRTDRYQAIDQSEYGLELYGNEQAVLSGDFGMVYPESSIILYAAPFSNDDGYRHLTINFLLDGDPVDVRPLIEFSERTDLPLSNAYNTEVRNTGISNPARIPVEVISQTTRPNSIDDEQTVDGALCENPFYEREDLLKKELDVENPTPIAKYSQLYAFLRDWHGIDSKNEYDTKRFLVTDWSHFTERIYANVMEVQFLINW